MSDITLVNVYFPVHHDEENTFMPPLGCLYLVAALKKAYIDVTFLDYQTVVPELDDAMEPKSLADFVKNESPIIAFSCMFNLMPFIILASRLIKEKNPDVKIVLGGPDPSGVASQIIDCFPWIDAVASGEGEEIIVSLVRYFHSKKGWNYIPGVTARHEGQTVHGPERRFLENLDELPLPAYSVLDSSKYNQQIIQTSRGCGLRCAFCDISGYWGYKFRQRPIEHIRKELSLEEQLWPKIPLSVRDDTFTHNIKRLDILLEIFSTRSGWGCFIRADHVNEEICKKLAEAKCKSIFIGVESGSERILKLINKGVTLNIIVAAIQIAVRYFDRVTCNFMWGFPNETRDEFEETAKLIAFSHITGAHCQTSLLAPMPYSSLYKQFGSALSFDKDVVSSMVTTKYFHHKRGIVMAGLSHEMLDLISNNLEAFPSFCHYDTDDFSSQVEVVKSMGHKFGDEYSSSINGQ